MPAFLDDPSTFAALVRRADAASSFPLLAVARASRPVPVLLAGLPSSALAPSCSVAASMPDLALAGQVIHPYTELQLHDMGDGLADDRPYVEASGRKGCTSSLRGIGLAQTVLPCSGYLHDGRARTLEEAILRHGGEADGARSRFEHLSAPDRRAMVSFLGSL